MALYASLSATAFSFLFTKFFTAFISILAGAGISIPIVHSLLAYRNTEYTITDQRRLITQTGAVGLDTRFMDLDKIQEVYVTVGIIDKIFGTGSVHTVTAAGWTAPVRGTTYSIVRPTLAALRNPYEVQETLQENDRQDPMKALLTSTRCRLLNAY